MPGYVEKSLEELRDFSQRTEDLIVRRSFLIVYFDELPAHHPFLVDDIGGWVRPALTVGIENPIAVDDLMTLILKQRKIEVSGKSFP